MTFKSVLQYETCVGMKLFNTFAAVSKLRHISPLLAAILLIFILAGSSGFTLIRHTCNHCNIIKVTATIGGLSQDCCSCSHEEEDTRHCHEEDGFTFDNDCCTHETEQFLTDVIVRTEVQTEIIPHFIAAVIVAVVHYDFDNDHFVPLKNATSHHGRELTTLHCQIIS